jgi:hypothetical protein
MNGSVITFIADLPRFKTKISNSHNGILNLQSGQEAVSKNDFNKTVQIF